MVWKRDLRPSSSLAFRKYLELLDIPNIFYKVASCEGKSSLLETIITTGLNFIMPLRPTTVRCDEPRWMNPELSTLITKRQKALNQGNTDKLKYLRNRVNRERKSVAQSIMKTVFNISNNVNHPPGGKKLRSLVVQILLAEIVKKFSKP